MNKGADLEVLIQVGDRCHPMNVDISKTVAHLKARVIEKFGIDVQPQELRLSIEDPPRDPLILEDEKSLQAYNLVFRVTLYAEVPGIQEYIAEDRERRPPTCTIYVKLLRDKDGAGSGPAVHEKDMIFQLDTLLVTTVGEIKSILEPMSGYPVGRMKLVYQGHEMDSDKTLVHYHVVPRAVVHLWPLANDER
jgi:hypothetical protein